MTDDSVASKAWPIFCFIFVISFQFTQGKKNLQFFFVATGETLKTLPSDYLRPNPC
jgi:hypothetical protein